MNTDLLAELIDKKHHVLEQLRQLSRRQTELIDQGDMTRLIRLLAAKQKLLGDLQSLESELHPFRDEDPESRQWRTPDARARCRQTAERCEALLGEIMLIEKQSESELTQRRDTVAAQLQGAHAASHATRAYTQSPPARSRQLDVTSEG